MSARSRALGGWIMVLALLGAGVGALAFAWSAADVAGLDAGFEAGVAFTTACIAVIAGWVARALKRGDP